MAKYLYTNEFMHCPCEQCPKHDKCWRFELWKMREGVATVYLPEPDKDLAKCEFFIDKENYRIK